MANTVLSRKSSSEMYQRRNGTVAMLSKYKPSIPTMPTMSAVSHVSIKPVVKSKFYNVKSLFSTAGKCCVYEESIKIYQYNEGTAQNSRGHQHK
jgi:hypothetical protein